MVYHSVIHSFLFLFFFFFFELFSAKPSKPVEIMRPVVQLQQSERQHLVDVEEMMNVRPAMLLAGVAGASLDQRRAVGQEEWIPEVDLLRLGSLVEREHQRQAPLCGHRGIVS